MHKYDWDKVWIKREEKASIGQNHEKKGQPKVDQIKRDKVQLNVSFLDKILS